MMGYISFFLVKARLHSCKNKAAFYYEQEYILAK